MADYDKLLMSTYDKCCKDGIMKNFADHISAVQNYLDDENKEYSEYDMLAVLYENWSDSSTRENAINMIDAVIQLMVLAKRNDERKFADGLQTLEMFISRIQ